MDPGGLPASRAQAEQKQSARRLFTTVNFLMPVLKHLTSALRTTEDAGRDLVTVSIDRPFREKAAITLAKRRMLQRRPAKSRNHRRGYGKHAGDGLVFDLMRLCSKMSLFRLSSSEQMRPGMRYRHKGIVDLAVGFITEVLQYKLSKSIFFLMCACSCTYIIGGYLC